VKEEKMKSLLTLAGVAAVSLATAAAAHDTTTGFASQGA
jgi:hypothetical protein